MKNKVLFIIAQKDFRDEEYLIPKEIFEINGFSVVTASVKSGKCIGKLKAEVTADISVYDANISDFDAIIFVGGQGSLVYEKDIEVLDMIKKAYVKDKLICAICIAPRILGAAKVLRNKNFTMWNEDGSQDDEIYEWEANYTAEDVEVDGVIITADGPKSSKRFAETIIKYIK